MNMHAEVAEPLVHNKKLSEIVILEELIELGVPVELITFDKTTGESVTTEIRHPDDITNIDTEEHNGRSCCINLRLEANMPRLTVSGVFSASCSSRVLTALEEAVYRLNECATKMQKGAGRFLVLGADSKATGVIFQPDNEAILSARGGVSAAMVYLKKAIPS